MTAYNPEILAKAKTMKPATIDLSKTDTTLWLSIGATHCVTIPASLYVTHEAPFPVQDVVRIGIAPDGRRGQLSFGLSRADIACHTSMQLTLDGSESHTTPVWVELRVPRPRGEVPNEVHVFLSHALFYPAEDNEDSEARDNRIAAEVERWGATQNVKATRTNNPDFILLQSMEVVRAIWSSVDDLTTVPRDLHPVDVLQKYVQRGNIRKDGKW